MNMYRVRTSLSTPLAERDMCHAIWVHVVWEPTQASSSPSVAGENYNRYDASRLLKFRYDAEFCRATEIFDLLGLRAVGWMFGYSDKRGTTTDGDNGNVDADDDDDDDDDDALPVYAPDVVAASLLQIANMRG